MPAIQKIHNQTTRHNQTSRHNQTPKHNQAHPDEQVNTKKRQQNHGQERRHDTYRHSSPSLSRTLWSGPKFTNTEPATPRTAALMKPMAGVWLWQNSLSDTSASMAGVAAPVNTTTWKRLHTQRASKSAENQSTNSLLNP
jgi:hypothetical protein